MTQSLRGLGSERQNMEKPERGEIPILPEYGEML